MQTVSFSKLENFPPINPVVSVEKCLSIVEKLHFILSHPLYMFFNINKFWYKESSLNQHLIANSMLLCDKY